MFLLIVRVLNKEKFKFCFERKNAVYTQIPQPTIMCTTDGCLTFSFWLVSCIVLGEGYQSQSVSSQVYFSRREQLPKVKNLTNLRISPMTPQNTITNIFVPSAFQKYSTCISSHKKILSGENWPNKCTVKHKQTCCVIKFNSAILFWYPLINSIK